MIYRQKKIQINAQRQVSSRTQYHNTGYIPKIDMMSRTIEKKVTRLYTVKDLSHLTVAVFNDSYA